MILVIFCSFLVSAVSQLWVRRWFKHHAADYSPNAPQRFHVGAVPRLGGIGMLLGWLVGLLLAMALPALGFFNGIHLTWSDLVLICTEI